MAPAVGSHSQRGAHGTRSTSTIRQIANRSSTCIGSGRVVQPDHAELVVEGNLRSDEGVQAVMYEEDRRELIAHGIDPDDPDVIELYNLIEWELEMLRGDY